MLKKVTKKCVLGVLVVVMTLMSFTIAFASKQDGIYNVLPQYNPLNATECGAP